MMRGFMESLTGSAAPITEPLPASRAVSPLELAAAEASLYPPETQFGSEPDPNALSSFAPPSTAWVSDNNDQRVSWENIQSFKARTEAMFEVMKNKLDQLESVCGHVVAMLQSKGR